MRGMIVAVLLAGFAGPAMAQNVGQMLDVAGWKVTRKMLGPTMQACLAAIVASDNMTAFAFGVTSANVSVVNLSDPAAPRSTLGPSRRFIVPMKALIGSLQSTCFISGLIRSGP